MNDVVSVPTRFLEITLQIADPEVIHELERRDDDGARDEFASQALRLGVLALRQANGSLDADAIRREGQHLLAAVDAVMQQRSAELSSSVTQTVVKYLDPVSGVLPQRIDRLTKPNGDLDTLLAKHLRGDQSVIAQTLAKHLGEQSPIFKLLSPTENDGVLAAFSETLDSALAAQREVLLQQFSLDHDGSALHRLSTMLIASHAEVRSTLDTFKTRREEAARSPRHGVTFEEQLGEQLAHESNRNGDICEHVGPLNGRTQRKLGDYVVELGPESASPGAHIVFEAKANKRYTIKNALTELAEARKNRNAQVGVLVFDRASAPDSMDSLHRVGADILVIWDADDPTTDVYLRAAFGLARTLTHRIVAAEANAHADFTAIDGLLDAVAAQVAALDAIEKGARRIEKDGRNIVTSAQAVRDALEFSVAALRGRLQGLHEGQS